MHEIASRHKQLRKKKKLSQAALAKRSGVSLGSIKRFEQSGQISLESLLKLAHLLACLNNFEKLFEIDINEDIEKLFSNTSKQ
jgi:transcriptional regulator with XRE-family HTH domain